MDYDIIKESTSAKDAIFKVKEENVVVPDVLSIIYQYMLPLFYDAKHTLDIFAFLQLRQQLKDCQCVYKFAHSNPNLFTGWIFTAYRLIPSETERPYIEENVLVLNVNITNIKQIDEILYLLT
jgi:hypothetical protein